jgi:hypothetical protein
LSEVPAGRESFLFAPSSGACKESSWSVTTPHTHLPGLS